MEFTEEAEALPGRHVAPGVSVIRRDPMPRSRRVAVSTIVWGGPGWVVWIRLGGQ
ncbi:hypothetical protein N007_00590 [Alicyclobacillus acidoterrestris ATCC 49025]|nr:hypothetical protein N007_00590 [Alicyclobacillus acidoterrestris ATCC 49025]